MAVEERFDYTPWLIDQLEYLEAHHLEIGIHADEESDLLMIARVHEFGTQIEVTDAMRGYLGAMGLHLRKDTEYIDIPERSYMRAGWDARRSDIEKRAKILLGRVLALEMEAEVALDTLGHYVAGQMQEYLTRLSDPPLHPFTEKRKRSTNPLVDTERLRGAIVHRVRG